jgi:hypothetical protein
LPFRLLLLALPLVVLPSAPRAAPELRRDLYAEAVAWNRVSGNEIPDNAVPTLRLRVLVEPFASLKLDLYGVVQATRDLASRGGVAPRVYADDRAIVGAGVQLRLLGGHAAVFAQMGPAFALVEDGKDPVLLDARAGGMAFFETRGCAPDTAGRRATLRLLPCADFYGEAVYLSRMEHDVVAVVRGRGGFTWATTGPVVWSLLAEGRAALDRVAHPYDNFTELGTVHRWRLMRPLRIDLLAGLHAGAFFRGRAEEPLPVDRGYLDFRLLAATWTEF